MGKNHLDISLISEYSRNILKQLGKESNNPVITITDVARTPRVQAERMYSMLSKDGVAHVKGVYVKKVHSVIDIYASLIKQNKSRHEILSAMTAEIKRLVALKLFQHCQDFRLKNTFDLSVHSLKNPSDFFKVAKHYEDTHKGFSIVDERHNTDKYYHIEIVQPHAH